MRWKKEWEDGWEKRMEEEIQWEEGEAEVERGREMRECWEEEVDREVERGWWEREEGGAVEAEAERDEIQKSWGSRDNMLIWWRNNWRRNWKRRDLKRSRRDERRYTLSLSSSLPPPHSFEIGNKTSSLLILFELL